MIEFGAVSKSFPGESGRLQPVLGRIDFRVRPNEFVCILGPSGCGKTTLLNLAAGFIFPSTGEIRVDGQPVTGPGPDRAMVFQEPTLFPWLNVRNNVAFGLHRQRPVPADLNQRVQTYLGLMGLENHAQKYPHTLSGGMRQRAAIARVLVLRPKVLLMDEPFSALDANTRERLQEELLSARNRLKQTVIYITHSVEEAAFLADRIIIMGGMPAGICADMPNILDHPRNRSGIDFGALTGQLRQLLAMQPCCIQPITPLGGIPK